MTVRNFSLFNTGRWNDACPPPPPDCCSVVPVLYQGPFDTAFVNSTMTYLGATGSVAARGFMNPQATPRLPTSLHHPYLKEHQGALSG